MLRYGQQFSYTIKIFLVKHRNHQKDSRGFLIKYLKKKINFLCVKMSSFQIIEQIESVIENLIKNRL